MPPSIVLEVMKVLEDEIALREETRAAEKARPAMEEKKYNQRAGDLAKAQGGIAEHTAKIVTMIEELEDGAKKFGKEIRLLNVVKQVMDEAEGILAQPNTGAPARAAETHAIELLLQAKRIKPGGGGGGGSSPGGGGGGTTQSSALAQLGQSKAKDSKPIKRTVGQSTGKAGKNYPEEFRNGLDEYFNRIEDKK